MSQQVYVLKLKSGEELIARIDTENMEPTIVLDQPLGIQVMMQPQGKPGFAMIPWMMASDDKKFTIDSNEVLTKGKARNEMEKQYLSAVTGLSL
tara:strand:+ start:173 stop:454 length:282 start_codon:yes stop_codon:yes gene_type:complete